MGGQGSGSSDFKARVAASLPIVARKYGCIETYEELFGVVFRNRRLGWIHLMDTDGLLVAKRQVSANPFDGERPTNPTAGGTDLP